LIGTTKKTSGIFKKPKIKNWSVVDRPIQKIMTLFNFQVLQLHHAEAVFAGKAEVAMEDHVACFNLL